jgi:predicted membrane protein
MTKRNQQFLALFLIGLGLLYFVANFIEIDAGDLFWPLVLILIGVILIFRPKSVIPDNSRHMFAGDVNIDSGWQPVDEELRMFAGDIDIDLRDIDLPEGDTHYAVRFFAGDINIILPSDVGLKISSSGFVVETKIDGESVSNVMTGWEYASENYETAEKRFNLTTTAFAVDLKIRNV